MTQLDGCIRHWESILFHDRYMLVPSTQVIIEHTVKYLKEYKELLKS